MKTSFKRIALDQLHKTAMVAAVLACASAQAEIRLTEDANFAGDYANIVYGNGGNLFELQPYLFVSGLGSADFAKGVTSRNPGLDFSWVAEQISANLLVLEYRVSNVSAFENFDQLRFMVYANPDGDNARYLDTVTQVWGAASSLDAVRREVMALPTLDNIISGFRLNNALSDGPPSGECAAASGCDASFAMQWNAATLKPGESFVVRVGLSDNGGTLSGRHLTATALDSINTAITFSGTGQIAAVPEPSTYAMTLAGLWLVGLFARRRRFTAEMG